MSRATANLQERIAALQQRSASTTTPNPISLPTANSFREKVARFEKKGGLPVPTRRTGELYGNRTPLPLRVVSAPSKPQPTPDSGLTRSPPDEPDSPRTAKPAARSPDPELPVKVESDTLDSADSKVKSDTDELDSVDNPVAALPDSELYVDSDTIAGITASRSTSSDSADSPGTTVAAQHPPPADKGPVVQSPEVESDTNEQTSTTGTSPTPLSQSESAQELQSVPELGINDQDQIPSSPTTPHAPTFTLSSTPAATPAECLAPSNASRPLSMLAINLSASSNPSPPLAETPTQGVYNDQDSGDYGKATDRDQPTAPNEPETQTISPLGEAADESGSVTVSSSNFRATVHHKVSEPPRRPPEPSLLPTQSKTPVRRVASAVPLGAGKSLDQNPGFPPSPGFGDLTDLLQSTVLLQERLERDDAPVSSSETAIVNSGVPVIVTDDDHDDGTNLRSHDVNIEVRRLSKEEVEENKRTLWKLQAKREEQARSKIRNGFFGPFGRASKNTLSEAPKDMFIDGAAVPPQRQQLYSKRSKSPSVLSTTKDIEPSSNAPGEANFHSKTLENQSTGSGNRKSSSLSPKNPKSGLSAFRLLASRSSPSSLRDCRHGYNGHGRNSVSTSSEFSSEDSAPSVVTPPGGVNEFGGLRSWLNMGSPQSKKGGDGMGNVEEKDGHMSRAVTFAGKIWQRARTRSGASTRSVHSLHGGWSHDPPPALPPLPDNLNASDGQAGEDTLGPLPMRKTPLLPRSSSSSVPSFSPRDTSPLLFDLNPSRLPTHRGLQTYRPHSPSAHSILSESPPSLSVAYRSRSDLGSTPPSPGQNSAKRRSWTSSASHCANSSVLDIDLFDAFPSVPENHPLVFPSSPSKHTHSLNSNSAISLPSSTLSGPHAPLLNRSMNMRGGPVSMLNTGLLSPAVDLTDSHGCTKKSAYLSPKLDIE